MHELEQQMATLRVNDAERRVVLVHLLTEVDNLTKAIEHLTNTINYAGGGTHAFAWVASIGSPFP